MRSGGLASICPDFLSVLTTTVILQSKLAMPQGSKATCSRIQPSVPTSRDDTCCPAKEIN